jgi:hypothetical protein
MFAPCPFSRILLLLSDFCKSAGAARCWHGFFFALDFAVVVVIVIAGNARDLPCRCSRHMLAFTAYCQANGDHLRQIDSLTPLSVKGQIRVSKRLKISRP